MGAGSQYWQKYLHVLYIWWNSSALRFEYHPNLLLYNEEEILMMPDPCQDDQALTVVHYCVVSEWQLSPASSKIQVCASEPWE